LGSNPPTVTGGNAAPQSAPSIPPNTNGPSGAKLQSAETVATANNADTTAPVNGSPPTVQQPGLPASLIKTSSNDGKSDDGKDSDSTDSAATTAPPAAPTQAQAAANPVQPVATAITVNTAENAAPAPASGSAANLTVGEQTKTRGRLTIVATTVASQNAPSAQDATDAASAKEASSATPADNTASAGAGSANDAAKAQAGSGRATEQTPPEPANDPSVSAPTSGPASANADRTAAPTTPPSQASTSEIAAIAPNTQGHDTANASGIGGLPNFGFSASTAAAASTSAAAAASDTASTTGVPIAGLAVAIAARAQQGSNQFDIKLSPPELGRIDVQLNVDSNGQVTSHMTVERPETLQLLQSQQPQLQTALEQAGLTTADNGLQFTLRDQSFSGQNNGSGSQSTPTQLVIPEPELAPIAATQIYARVGLGSGVDIRV
jgi:flagellar hook-length control protein FliK